MTLAICYPRLSNQALSTDRRVAQQYTIVLMEIVRRRCNGEESPTEGTSDFTGHPR